MNEVGINYHKALGENVHNTWNIQHTFISESFNNTVKLPRAVWQCAGSKVLDCISEQTLLTIDTVYKVVRNEAQLCKNYKKIILMGWSGGGSLSLFYQAEALNSSITETPAGDPIDIHKAKLIPADLVVFIAAHIGRAKILSEWIDPSVRNESDPEDREIDLDLYNSNNPNKPPYDEDYIKRYRIAQKARITKITSSVIELLNNERKFSCRSHGSIEARRILGILVLFSIVLINL